MNFLRHRDGIRLRTYLTALVLAPLLACAAFAGLAVAERVHDADAAAGVAERVRNAAALQTAQNDIQGELIPTVAYVVIKDPTLHAVAGLGGLTLEEVHLSDDVVALLRGRTDDDLDAIAARPGLAGIAAATRSQLAVARREIDSARQLPAGFARTAALSKTLITRARTEMGSAMVGGTGAELNRAVRDTILVNTGTQVAASELAYLTALQFPGLGADQTETVAREAWLTGWADFSSASSGVLTQATPATAAKWRGALSDPATTVLQRELAKFAVDPDHDLKITNLVGIYQANVARQINLGDIANATSRHAVALAEDSAHASDRSAGLIGLLAVLAVIAAMVIVFLIRRSIARPLQALSRQADLVSEGELVDVPIAGPREVRTVGRGLSSAVANLRRVEAQAGAVAAGDLDSEIVLEPLPGPLGEVMHSSVGKLIDAIQERDAAQSDLAHQATHDALTGLANRTQALVSIGHALQRARRSGEPTALVFVDLDFFKFVNDNLGHAAGDEVLREVARRMQSVVRDSDVVYRLGGDEFVILLEDVSGDFPFVAMAERLIEMVSAPITVGKASAQVGASVGISLCQDASLDAERLLAEADAAAYSAKAAGRGRVGVFDENLRAALTHRAETERALQHALEHDEFLLHYQPVVEMGTSRPIGFEALIRWEHPERGLVPPGDFIPVAEKSTLINRIGRWTLHEATTQLARWDADGVLSADRTIAVNVSGRHLVSPDLVADVRSALDTSGIDPRRLVVEITETVLVDDPIALHNMHEIRALGVVVAIDDFGTGYTSIGQLPKLPIDVLKIDRSFTISDQPAHRQLVRLIVEAAHAFGLSVVAEGIERAAQADSLKELDVDTGQGYFFAYPRPAIEAGELGARSSLPHVIDSGPPVDRIDSDDEPPTVFGPLSVDSAAIGPLPIEGLGDPLPAESGVDGPESPALPGEPAE